MHNETDAIELFEIKPTLHNLFTIAYSLVSIVSVCGNVAIMGVVVLRPRMHNVTNYFIANMALVDIILSILTTPFQFHAAILQYWPWLPVLCKVAPFASTLNINVSVLTLAAISLDRFYVIFYPLQPKLRFKHFLYIMSLIWIVSILISSFNLFIYEIRQNLPENDSDSGLFNQTAAGPTNHAEYVCEVVNFKIFHYFLATEIFFQFVLPLGLITFSVMAIYYKIELQKRDLMCRFDFNQSVRRVENKKKCIKMIIIVLAVFLICWTPLHTYNMLQIINSNINCYMYINVIWLVINLIAMSNSCYNVFIYGLFSTKFRNEFKMIYRMLKRRQRAKNQMNSDTMDLQPYSSFKRNYSTF